jgi:hypothetical protein
MAQNCVSSGVPNRTSARRHVPPTANENGGGAPLIGSDSPTAWLADVLLFRSVDPGAEHRMQTITPLSEPIGDRDPLSIKVVTSELISPYKMDFILSDVSTGSVLSFGKVYASREAFIQATLKGTPCGDRYSKNGSSHFLGSCRSQPHSLH